MLICEVQPAAHRTIAVFRLWRRARYFALPWLGVLGRGLTACTSSSISTRKTMPGQRRMAVPFRHVGGTLNGSLFDRCWGGRSDARKLRIEIVCMSLCHRERGITVVDEYYRWLPIPGWACVMTAMPDGKNETSDASLSCPLERACVLQPRHSITKMVVCCPLDPHGDCCPHAFHYAGHQYCAELFRAAFGLGK